MILTKDGKILIKDGQILTTDKSGGSSCEVVMTGHMTIGDATSAGPAIGGLEELISLMQQYAYGSRTPKLMRMKLQIAGNQFGNGIFFEELFAFSTGVFNQSQTRESSNGTRYALQIVSYGGVNITVYVYTPEEDEYSFNLQTQETENGGNIIATKNGETTSVGSVVSTVWLKELTFIY